VKQRIVLQGHFTLIFASAMGDKDAKFTFSRPADAEDRDPTVRDVRRLELEQTGDGARLVGGFNPYDRDVRTKAPAPEPAARTSTTARTDLRKLSEWIKLRQDVEARKSSEASEAERVPTVRIPKPKF
jgi:hypothetical protein